MTRRRLIAYSGTFAEQIAARGFVHIAHEIGFSSAEFKQEVYLPYWTKPAGRGFFRMAGENPGAINTERSAEGGEGWEATDGARSLMRGASVLNGFEGHRGCFNTT